MNTFPRWISLVLLAISLPVTAQSDAPVDHSTMHHGAQAAPADEDTEETDESLTPKSSSPEEEVDHAAVGHGAPAAPPAEVDHAAMGHTAPTSPPAAVDHAAMGHAMQTEEVDHAAMGHAAPTAPPAEVDHAAMGHAMPTEEVDHAAMGHAAPTSPPAEVDHAAMGHAMPTEEVDHAAMGHDTPASVGEIDHAAMGHGTPPAASEATDHAGMHHAPAATGGVMPTTPIPELTAADRAAAVRPAAGHPAHDNKVHQYVLIDRLEAGWSDGENSQGWEVQAWRGTDLNRLWLRSEGERAGGRTEGADVELLYGRSVSPWWDVVAGVRHEFGEAPSQTMAAFGVQGLAPYKYEFSATAYVGSSGQTALDLEAEYDTLLTNRLILQWTAEAEFWGRDDERRGIGSGLNSVEAGMRLRYEIRRQLAPYIGVVWERRFGDAADAVRADGHDVSETRVVAGLRFWF